MVSKVGSFLGYDEANIYSSVDKSVNFQVNVDITAPLRRGIKIVVEKQTLWIPFKYVKFPDFCYACGKLGHVTKSCEKYEEETPDEDLQYGD